MGMNKNDYRRAYIMMRARAQGCAGHVRLERRTLMGSMYFVAAAPTAMGQLWAALAGRQGDRVHAVLMGAMRRDARGQATLACEFDPRSIQGRPLESYPLAVIAASGPDGCRVLLTGSLESARPMDADAVEEAVCALLAPSGGPASEMTDGKARPGPLDPMDAVASGDMPEGEPAADIPDVGTPWDTGPQDEARQMQIDEASANPHEGGDTPEYSSDGTRIFTRRRPARSATRSSGPQDGPVSGETDPANEAGAAGERADAAQSAGIPESPEDASGPQATVDSRAPSTAAGLLKLDEAQDWPDAIASLRPLFEAQPPVDSGLGDGYVYVRAPMPERCPSAWCLVGLRRDAGGFGVRYAIPGAFAPEPPAGLEGYVWREDGDHGFWTLDVPPTPAGG